MFRIKKSKSPDFVLWYDVQWQLYYRKVLIIGPFIASSVGVNATDGKDRSLTVH
jgi:hypothetical protein